MWWWRRRSACTPAGAAAVRRRTGPPRARSGDVVWCVARAPVARLSHAGAVWWVGSLPIASAGPVSVGTARQVGTSRPGNGVVRFHACLWVQW